VSRSTSRFAVPLSVVALTAGLAACGGSADAGAPAALRRRPPRPSRSASGTGSARPRSRPA